MERKPETQIVSANTELVNMREMAEIESQIATAKRYPRNIKTFKAELMAMANLDQETAEGCYYVLPRGDKPIDGPSVRLAEIALSCYGNCIAGADVESEDEKFIYATGRCRDLERNVAVQVKVRRRITYKNGNRFNDDMIAVTANAACSIALRNAIFKVVPAAYIKPAFDKVKETAVGKADGLTARRANVLQRLAKMGANEERVLCVMKRQSVDDLNFDDVAALIGMGTAVHDGDMELDKAFPPITKPQPTGAAGLADRLNEKANQAPAKKQPDKPLEPVKPTEAQKKAGAAKGKKAKEELVKAEAKAKMREAARKFDERQAKAAAPAETPQKAAEPEPKAETQTETGLSTPAEKYRCGEADCGAVFDFPEPIDNSGEVGCPECGSTDICGNTLED